MLHQGCPHCAIFLTAASRRSMGRVSVPLWGIALSRPLAVLALVSHYPTNKLIARRPISRHRSFSQGRLNSLTFGVLALVSQGYPPPRGRSPTCYSPVRHCTRFPKIAFSFDLHVLGTPPAFILSQDQTLHKIILPSRLHLLRIDSLWANHIDCFLSLFSC